MALFVLIGVLRGFPVAAYRRTPLRKPLCGLDQDKNCSFLNWTPLVFILNSWMDTITYLKNNLSVHGCVAKRFKMLTYYVYAPLFHRFAPCPEP